MAFLSHDAPLFGSSGHQGTVLNHQGDAAVCDDILKQVKMKSIVLLAVACAAHAADAFHPWALNDSKAFVFPRIAEKRNRGRRERLAAALHNDGDAIAAALRFVDWNSLGVAWPRGVLRRLPAAFAALVANGRADRAMLEMDHKPMYDSDGRRLRANADAAALY